VRVHGFERTAELEDALAVPAFSPTVAIRDGRLVAYAATLTFFPAAHAVGETEEDMAALIAVTRGVTDQPCAFLLPTRQAELFRWLPCTGPAGREADDLHDGRPLRDPRRTWIPSVLY
jgi:hypothetical protein